MGGLGNQMFQAAHAYSQSLKHNRPSVFFNECQTNLQGNTVNSYINNIFSKLNFVDKINDLEMVTSNGWYYNEINPVENNTIFFGYYQSSKNFLGYDDEIIKLFSPNEDFVTKMLNKYPQLENDNTVSLHVRRGDYLSFPNVHPVISTSYIDKCLNMLNEKDFIFCFSDDKEWVKQNIRYNNIIFVDGLLDYEELWLMSLCKHNILSNSTFSWWGAFLNKNKNKQVFAPSMWFALDGPNNYNDIFEKNWNIINVENINGNLILKQ